jgi:hypothetical protein
MQMGRKSAPMEYTITVEDAAPDQVRDAIVRLVVEYNNSKAGPSNGRPL